MLIGELKKEGNQYQDLYSHWQEEQYHGHQRSKALWHCQAWNRNTWHYSTLSRNRSGSTDFSKSSAMMSLTRTPSTQTVRVPLRLQTILNIMQEQSTSISSITSSGTV